MDLSHLLVLIQIKTAMETAAIIAAPIAIRAALPRMIRRVVAVFREGSFIVKPED